jgi:hypothetical protein
VENAPTEEGVMKRMHIIASLIKKIPSDYLAVQFSLCKIYFGIFQMRAAK